ncbi:MAG TPA: DUF1614 domain-containing protein [Syntrophorhabdales bacterium]|nr:DUF1614 domain-containing protein [Syntrophorhabdales bacterium]
MHYFPIALPFLLLFALLFFVLIIFIEIGILRYAYERIGVGRRYMFALLILSFLGSYVNIPIFQLPAHKVASGEMVNFFGMLYVVPVVRDWPGTIVAVNLGGAVIPTFLSIYLMVKNRLYRSGLVAVAIVTFFVHLMAYPVPGVGIAIPVFIPPLIATVIALFLSRQYAAPLAYMAGSLGTLLGADILNLERVQALGAPVASIGGAGTFDGIFMTGILSVLMASLMTGRRSQVQ